jgi:hypothetical protein
MKPRPFRNQHKEMKMKVLKLLLLTVSLICSQGAFAHSDEYLDTQMAPHGGQLRMAGAQHYELLVEPDEVKVYLTDHAGVRIASEGATGVAVVLSGKTKVSLKLQPAGGNMLRGVGKFALTPDLKVAVSITLPGQAAQQASFTPMKKMKAGK